MITDSTNPQARSRHPGRSRHVPVFLAATFALTWASWFLAWKVAGGTFAPGRPRGILTTLIFFVGVFAPAMVALFITHVESGSGGVRALLSKLVKVDVAARWYVYALTYMAVIKVVAALVHQVIFGAWPPMGETPIVVMLGATLLSTLLMGQSGEEIGWRGFLLPRVAARFGLALSSVIVGVIWATWHLPLFFLAGAETTGQSFPLYVLQVTALSVAIAWLYANTKGSLFLTMLMHAAINNTKDIFPSGGRTPANPFSLNSSAMGWIAAGILSLAATYLLTRMRHGTIGD